VSVDAADVLLVFTGLPDEAAARQLARHVVESGLAACASVLAPCVSTYRWRGAIEEATEVQVLIKTAARRYAELESAIRACHPYELPEIVAVPLARGLPAYLEWAVTETRTDA
jgi:periplasmic divalent cation tolerance protein